MVWLIGSDWYLDIHHLNRNNFFSAHKNAQTIVHIFWKKYLLHKISHKHNNDRIFGKDSLATLVALVRVWSARPAWRVVGTSLRHDYVTWFFAWRLAKAKRVVVERVAAILLLWKIDPVSRRRRCSAGCTHPERQSRVVSWHKQVHDLINLSKRIRVIAGGPFGVSWTHPAEPPV